MRQSRKNSKKNLFVVLLYLITATSVFSQSSSVTEFNYEQISKRLTENVLANLEIGLNSKIDGIRMDCVNYVGKYKIIQFEQMIIDMLDDEELFENKATVALTLFQLGSYKSIFALVNYQSSEENEPINILCNKLVREFRKDQLENTNLVFQIEKSMALNGYKQKE